MRGKLYVVYASGAAHLLDAEILWTTEDRQETIAQAKAQGGTVYAYDMEGDELINETCIYDGTSRVARTAKTAPGVIHFHACSTSGAK
jgi:hypothetical protein